MFLRILNERTNHKKKFDKIKMRKGRFFFAIDKCGYKKESLKALKGEELNEQCIITTTAMTASTTATKKTNRKENLLMAFLWNVFV